MISTFAMYKTYLFIFTFHVTLSRTLLQQQPVCTETRTTFTTFKSLMNKILFTSVINLLLFMLQIES